MLKLVVQRKTIPQSGGKPHSVQNSSRGLQVPCQSRQRLECGRFSAAFERSETFQAANPFGTRQKRRSTARSPDAARLPGHGCLDHTRVGEGLFPSSCSERDDGATGREKRHPTLQYILYIDKLRRRCESGRVIPQWRGRGLVLVGGPRAPEGRSLT